MSLDDSSLPATWITEARLAMLAWSQAGAEFEFKDRALSENRVYTVNRGRFGGALALTKLVPQQPNTALQSCRIEVNVHFSFRPVHNVEQGDISAGQWHLRSVLLHEFGHALHLLHSRDEATVMYSYLPPETEKGLSTGDVDAIKALYPTVSEVVGDPITVDLVLAPMSLTQLCREAELIVSGRVLHVHAGELARDLVSGEEIVFTDVEVEIHSSYKSRYKDSTVTVRSLGGSTPQLSLEVSESPHFAPNEEVVLFLSRDDGGMFKLDGHQYVVHGWAAGKYTVHNDFASSAVSSRPVPVAKLIKSIERQTGALV